MKPDGGPAFPFEYNIRNEDDRIAHTGMSLRQWYAGMAMQGLLANGKNGDISGWAFIYADAMIAEEEKQ